MGRSSFLVALNCTQFLFGFTSNIAKSLQSQTVDVIKAHTGIKLSITEIRNVRSNAEKEFDSIFIKVVEMANDCVAAIQIKRRCQQQTNRENYEGEPKDFYRNSIFKSYLDNLISQLESGFNQINLSAMRALHLIPKNLDSLTREFQTGILIYYCEELQNTDCFEQEVRLWKCFWSQSEELPSTPHETIKKVDENTFPLISKILKLLMLIPATAATVEKAHSSLKFVKNDLRSTMSEDRMKALMLLYIHKDLSLNYDQVIDDFARRNPRKMLLVYRLG